MAIKDWPFRTSRGTAACSRRRLLADAELLAILLRTGSGKERGRPCTPAARRFGSVGGCRCGIHEPRGDPGLGSASSAAPGALEWRAVPQGGNLSQMRCRPPRAVRDYCGLRSAGREQEVFAVLLLDAQPRHRLQELFRGTLTQTSGLPRSGEVAPCGIRGGRDFPRITPLRCRGAEPCDEISPAR